MTVDEITAIDQRIEALIGDVNQDGLVNLTDIAIVGDYWMEGLEWTQ